jgi:hypothetical protein
MSLTPMSQKLRVGPPGWFFLATDPSGSQLVVDLGTVTTRRPVTIHYTQTSHHPRKEEPPSSPVDRLVPGRGETRSGVQSYRHRQPW